MAEKTFTHIGTLVGDARSPANLQVVLRETKHHFITRRGDKYKKSTGRKVCEDKWPIYHLDLSTVRTINTTESHG